MDLSSFAGVGKIILISIPFIAIIWITVYILKKTEAKLRKEVAIEEYNREKYKYELKKIKKIKKLKKRLDAIDELAKQFFKERLGLKKDINYYIIEKKAKKDSPLEKFSHMMLNLIFKGLEPTQERIELLEKLFLELVSEKD